MNIGTLSIMFSYGQVAGYSFGGETYVRKGMNATTQRHLNKWRDFRTHKSTLRPALIAGLLASLSLESEALLTAATNGDTPMFDRGNTAPLRAASEDDDLEELDDVVEEEDDEDLDDDDDLDDDLDDEDDDDEDLDDDLDDDDLDDEPLETDDDLAQDQY